MKYILKQAWLQVRDWYVNAERDAKERLEQLSQAQAAAGAYDEAVQTYTGSPEEASSRRRSRRRRQSLLGGFRRR